MIGSNGKRPGSVDEAVRLLVANPAVDGVENVPLANALSRILAEDITAPFPIAPHDSAAMDGFAFRFADLPSERWMEVVGHVAAGHPMTMPLPTGKAVRIFTGGAMPQGSDTVALQEDCAVVGGSVFLPSHLYEGANRRTAGEDVNQGDTILCIGNRLRPQDIGIAAATGRTNLSVRRRVRVAVFSTGDELRVLGEPLPPGCIYDSNRYAIAAALRGLGAEVTDLGLLPDRIDRIRGVIAAAAPCHDLVISSGGVSAGDEDHVRQALSESGTLDFWKLSIKPGKPIAVGKVAGTPFIGLPGNPVAAMISFWLIARPLVLRLMGVLDSTAPRIPVIANFCHHHTRGRKEYLRARVRRDSASCLRADIYHSTSSGMMSSLVWSNGLLEVHQDRGDIKAGELVDFISFDSLLS